MQKFLMYCIRWQLSSPILFGVLWFTLEDLTVFQATVLSNFIGACIFFKVDEWIMKGRKR
jgi:hypothetical protein